MRLDGNIGTVPSWRSRAERLVSAFLAFHDGKNGGGQSRIAPHAVTRTTGKKAALSTVPSRRSRAERLASALLAFS
jgi:hypothetical protein